MNWMARWQRYNGSHKYINAQINFYKNNSLFFTSYNVGNAKKRDQILTLTLSSLKPGLTLYTAKNSREIHYKYIYMSMCMCIFWCSCCSLTHFQVPISISRYLCLIIS